MELLDKLRDPAAQVVKQGFLLVHAGRPEGLVRDMVHLVPYAGTGRRLHPARTKILVQQFMHPAAHIGRHVNTVGNVPDGRFRHRQALPEVVPHVARNNAVQTAHTVGPARMPQSQHRHFKGIAVAALYLPKLHKLLPGQTKVGRNSAEIPFHQLQRKRFVASRHRGMRGKHRVGAHPHSCLSIVHAHAQAFLKAFHGHKSRMPFIHMKNAWHYVHRAQQPHTAHAQQHFLQQAHLAVCLVELVGNAAVFVRIAAGVRIHEVQGYAAHSQLPHPCKQQTSRQFKLHIDWLVVRIVHHRNRHEAEVVDGILGHLSPICVYILPEVAVFV